MPRVRQQYEADIPPEVNLPTDYPNPVNRYEVQCTECGMVLYVDHEMYEDLTRAAEHGIDKPFLCSDCDREIDEAEFE